VHGPYELHDIGDLALEEGGTIRGCKLACATFGRLTAIATTPSSFDVVLRDQQDHRAGVIARAGALDPDKYFSSSSIKSAAGSRARRTTRRRRPGWRIFRVCEIGATCGAAQAGDGDVWPQKPRAGRRGSMGAQQTYEWAVRYPDMVRRAAPIAGTGGGNTLHDFLLRKRWSRRSPPTPASTNGFYTSPADVREGLLRHAKLWAVMGWSTAFFQEDRHKALGFSSLEIS